VGWCTDFEVVESRDPQGLSSAGQVDDDTVIFQHKSMATQEEVDKEVLECPDNEIERAEAHANFVMHFCTFMLSGWALAAGTCLGARWAFENRSIAIFEEL